MAENNTATPDRLDTIESRLRRLEERIDQREMRETAVEPWQSLVRRQHPWRKQLYVKGRNMTARQLVGSMKMLTGGQGQRSTVPTKGEAHADGVI